MPLNEKGKEIKSAMERQYGKQAGAHIFYASENKGNIEGVTASDDVPIVSYRSSLPSGNTIRELNEKNHQLWHTPLNSEGTNDVKTEFANSIAPEQGDAPLSDQGNNWMPGERKLPAGNQAMLTPPIQASRYNQPFESLFESSAGQVAGDSNLSKKENNMDDGVNFNPQINKSNFNRGAGITGNPSDQDRNMSRSADDKEDELFETPGTPMDLGQNPQKYLQPQASYNYSSVIGSGQDPTSGPGITPPAEMSGKRPDVRKINSEYKEVGKTGLSDLNKINKNYWSKNVDFTGRGGSK